MSIFTIKNTAVHLRLIAAAMLLAATGSAQTFQMIHGSGYPSGSGFGSYYTVNCAQGNFTGAPVLTRSHSFNTNGVLFSFGVANNSEPPSTDPSMYSFPYWPPDSLGGVLLGAVIYHTSYLLDSAIVALTCNYDNELYAAGHGISKYNTQYHYFDYLGPLPPEMQAGGSLAFRSGRLYLTTIHNTLVEVNLEDPMNSTLLHSFPPDTPFFDALATYPYRCDSIVTYAIGHDSTGSKVYILDFDTYELTEVCSMDYAVFAAASRTECILPPCELLVDLDADDSSGLPERDFRADTICLPPVAIADSDTRISSQIPLDSIIVRLPGSPPDGALEFLSLAGAPPSLIVNGAGTARISLVSDGSASDEDFENALKGIRYENAAPAPSPGTRQIVVQSHALIYSGLPALSFITIDPEALRADAVLTLPACYGGTDGGISLAGAGGIAPYSFSWGDGQTGNALQGIGAGVYPFTITDANGCARSDTVQLAEPDSLWVILHADPEAVCGDKGVISAQPQGGIGNYHFVWSNGDTTAQATGLGAGIYYLTLTDEAGCTTMGSASIIGIDTVFTRQVAVSICSGETYFFNGRILDSPGLYYDTLAATNGCDTLVELHLDLLPGAVITWNSEGRLCEGDMVAISGGTFSAYQWSDGTTAATLLSDVPGGYGLTVTNAAGCSAIDTFVLEDDRLKVAWEWTPPDCHGDPGGYWEATVQGGAPPYRYSLDGGQTFQASPVFENLAPGVYDLRVEDSSGCFHLESLQLQGPPPLFLQLPEDETLRLGDSLYVNPATNAAASEVRWRPSDAVACDTCLATWLRPAVTTAYTLEVADTSGCVLTAGMRVIIDRKSGVFIPNVFSPNDDGINDVFTVYADQSVRRIVFLEVYDRWGGLAYRAENTAPGAIPGWDGKARGRPMPAGVYLYRLAIERIDGEIEQSAGEVILIR